jgi:precorrin-6Y C5,15-methyltransferase (decarboxylating)
MIEKVKRAKIGKAPVVVLATGDPGFFGIGELIAKELGKNSVTIIPNVSIVQEAFARIKESSNGLNTISVHGEKGSEDRNIDKAVGLILRSKKTAVYTDPLATPEKIAKALIKKGAKGYRVIVFESLGTKEEKITRGGLSLIAGRRFNPLNLLVFFAPDGDGDEPRGFGLPVIEYKHTNGLITKSEVRAVTLSKLALTDKSGLVLWDVGSGSGSVSIESSTFMPSGSVYAIEKKADRIKNIEANRARFKRANVEIIKGSAPACLKKLPDPDRVFVGGGGRSVPDILKIVSIRLRAGGTVVVNAVTISTLTRATSFFTDIGWPFELVQMNVARGREVGGYMIMEAENPVSIITARRP